MTITIPVWIVWMLFTAILLSIICHILNIIRLKREIKKNIEIRGEKCSQK